jgi:hypothetical protein
LYGGIHFRDAIENGVKQGEQIGKFVITHISDYRLAVEKGETNFSEQIKK